MAGASDIRAGRAFVELTLKDSLTRNLRNAQEKLRDFGKGMMVAGVAVTAAGTAMKGLLAFALDRFAGSSDELDKMSQRTGVSATSLSELGYAAQQSGQDIGTLEDSLKKMQKTIGLAFQGNDEAVTSLARLGISLGTLKGLSPDKQFELIGDSIAKISDPTMRATMAMQIFGRSGTALLPLMGHIEQLRKEARDLGLSKSQSDISMGTALSDAFTRFKAVIDSVAYAVGSVLAPKMLEFLEIGTNVAHLVADWVRVNKGLFIVISAVASGVIAGGLAMMGFRWAATLTSAALGGLATVLSIIGGILGAVLSPIGLLVGGLVAGAAAWMKFTESGRVAAAGIMAVLRSIGSVFAETFTGLVNAISAGEWAMAGKIAITGLKLALLEGWDAIKAAALSVWPTIQNAWSDSLNAMLDVAQAIWMEIGNVWTTAQTSVGTAALEFLGFLGNAFGDAINGIQNVWKTVWTGIENFFAKTIAGLLDSLAEFVGAIPGAHEALVAFMGSDERDWSQIGQTMRKGIDNRNKSLADSKNKNDAESQERHKEVDDAVGMLKQRDAEIKKQRQTQYDKDVADRHNAGRATNPSAEVDPRIAQTKSDLDKLTNDAKTAHDKFLADRDKKKDDHAKEMAGVETNGSFTKQQTFGSFSAAALVAGGGGPGKHLADIAKQTAGTREAVISLHKQISTLSDEIGRNLQIA
jgi:hypothetical protein